MFSLIVRDLDINLMKNRYVWKGILAYSCWCCHDPENNSAQRPNASDSVSITEVPAKNGNVTVTSRPVNNLSIAEETRFSAKNPEQQRQVEAYRQSINAIDETYKTDVRRIELYMKLVEKKKPLRVRNFDRAPGNLETSYNLYRDSLGVVRFVLESPFNKSGDYLNTFAHYFDDQGRTFAFVRTSNFFHSDCTSGAASEISAYFFGQNQQLIQKMYELKASDGKPLNPDSCVFKYRKNYKIYYKRDGLLQAIDLK